LYTRIEVGEEFWTSKDGVRTYDPALLELIRTPKNIISGHAIITTRLDYTKPTNEGRWLNSWGVEYCDKGFSRFGVDDWLGKYMTECWVISDKFTHTFNQNLSIGMNNDEVDYLQTALKLLGFFDHENTGFFGWITFRAVQAFQRSKGISPIGICGPATRKALNSLFSG
jgi:hypothetical protein